MVEKPRGSRRIFQRYVLCVLMLLFKCTAVVDFKVEQTLEHRLLPPMSLLHILCDWKEGGKKP